MPSITTWNRLEPSTDDTDVKAGLQAKLHDPLWLLARQWQMGELQGEDGGSPVEARIRARSSTITRFRAGASEPVLPYDPKKKPLETLVEAEPANEVSLRDAARAGLAFLRLLRSHERLKAYVGRVIRAHGFPPAETAGEPDPATRRFLQSMQARTPDGRQLHSAHRAAFQEDRSLATATLRILIDERDEPAYRTFLADWMVRHWDLLEPVTRASSWLPGRMEYGFSVGTKGGAEEIVLRAREHRGDQLDWHSFQRASEPLPAGRGDTSNHNSVVEREHRLLPTRVGFPGMRKPRFWQFEDARFDFGGVTAGAFDLARMLLIEFASGYRNNWYLVPLDLDVGAWHRIASLTVRDTFGVEFEISPAGGADPGPWRLFAISGSAARDGLFLYPALPRPLSGNAIEEVRLVRDEMANCGWAIEQVVESRLGQPVDRAGQLPRQPVTPRSSETVPKYRLGSTVPDYWLPLVPVAESPGNSSIRFRLGRLGSSPGAPTAPRSKILMELEAATPPTVFEEDVPPTGLVISRTPQLARWIDGSTHLWIRRQKKTGRCQADSGLRFDIVE